MNLHPNLSLENHGFFNPIYEQVVHVSIGDAAIFYGVREPPAPASVLSPYHTEAVWDQVLAQARDG